MKRLIQGVVIWLLLLFCVNIIIPTPTFAAENFDTSYEVSYTILESGLTHVTFHITLTNTTSQYYASSYSIDLGFKSIENVTASDASGPLTKEVIATKDQQTIIVHFSKNVVGIGKELSFTIGFDTNEVASKHGMIWEVNIPGLTNQNEFTNFNVSVYYPPSFQPPAYIKPAVNKDSLKEKRLVFTKDQLLDSGISIAFGSSQLYQFSLSYHLQNTNLYPVTTEIALPPSTNYQSVVISSLNPRPTQVTIDRDGNWLASYKLAPSQKITVVAKGQAELFLNPKPSPQTETELQDYLKPQPYWESQNQEIIQIAKTLKTPQDIYQYVISHLTYDFSRVLDSKPRLGAHEILRNPDSAVCLEFTDLFIALARASGIPAREIDGYAFTENSRQRPLSLVKDVLHAWPEYYDREKQTWIMIDPTWGNTTKGVDYFSVLDFDHFAFVRKGIESEYPVPAGGYKLDGQEEIKDVDITFSELPQQSTQQIEITPLLATHYLSALPISGSVKISNKGNSLIPAHTLILTNTFLKPTTQTITIAPIPPYGYVIKEFTFEKTPFLTNAKNITTIHSGTKSLRHEMIIAPFVLTKQSLLLGGIIGGILSLFIFIITFAARRLSIFRRNG